MELNKLLTKDQFISLLFSDRNLSANDKWLYLCKYIELLSQDKEAYYSYGNIAIQMSSIYVSNESGVLSKCKDLGELAGIFSGRLDAVIELSID